MRSARFGFRETPRTPETPPVPPVVKVPLHCPYCGRLTSSWTRCDACGGVYCEVCTASPPDEGGFDCPNLECTHCPLD